MAANPRGPWALRAQGEDAALLAMFPVPGREGVYTIGRHETVDLKVTTQKQNTLVRAQPAMYSTAWSRACLLIATIFASRACMHTRARDAPSTAVLFS